MFDAERGDAQRRVALNNIAERDAHEVAMLALVAMDLPEEEMLPETLHGLGRVWAGEYARVRAQLTNGDEQLLTRVVALANKCAWYAAHYGAAWFGVASAIGLVVESDYTRQFMTPRGYVEHEGWAWPLCNKLAEKTMAGRILEFGGAWLEGEIPDNATLLQAIALHWLAQASLHDDDIRFDLMGEASIALELASEIDMYEAGEQAGREDATGGHGGDATREVRKALALAGAHGRILKDPRTPAKAEVRKKWLEWQQRPYLYASQAEFARQMLKDFAALTSQPVIEGWAREWKKDPTEPTNALSAS